MANIDRNLVVGYIESLKEELENLSDSLYYLKKDENHEKNAYDILINFLSRHQFKIDKVQEVPNSFIANLGEGDKKIGFICEFEALKNGYVNGHNLQCAMNIGAALGLKRILDKLNCKILIFGLPKEETLPLKISFANRHLFDDLNLIVCGHPGEKTYEGVTSMAMSMISFEFFGKQADFNLNPHEGLSSLNPIIKFLDILQDLNNKCNSHLINYTINCDNQNIFIIPEKSQCCVAIKTTEMESLEVIKDKIIESARFVCKLFSCDFNYNILHEYMPIKKNVDLIKITSHNLKECGITNIHGLLSTALSLDIGHISQKVPTVHPYIGICENGEKYGTEEFKEATIKKYAKSMLVKSACALALTAYDYLKSSNLP
ncbi:Metal-dependent amidase/aminoacylase/carboxypeptidase [Caloramator fervidus]|uniref:Peptidase M20 domain-containing protein 2 n=1 Tax=Caloramator fervidus TaxID=29344 RepID=A0A1H5XQ25_9CLOT|nr:hypothetical protein [Caloramator fervidus]SEG13869.1 Metal-dependent amidase/aminoacylase/carboxypeptidase [Caloramator fervidus]